MNSCCGLRIVMNSTWIMMIVAIVSYVGGVRSECDLVKAEVCVKEMEDVVKEVLDTTTGVHREQRLQNLCLDVIKGNNLTQCFINATSECTENNGLSPTSSRQRWERVMQDLYSLCDGACPNFLQRTVNITQCTAIIRFDALYASSYDLFCRSLNQSLECVNNVSDTCPQFSKLFYDLLPDGMEDTASTICIGGCDNFDDSLSKLEQCKKHVLDMPDDLDKACASYEKFKTCISQSGAPVSCPMFSSLMEVLYPQHIFGLYEESCNQTQTADDETGQDEKCGDVGVARVDHCLRVFALSWPAAGHEKSLTTEQCDDFVTATRCLDLAGYNDCPKLREYFQQQLGERKDQRELMDKQCPQIMGQSSPGSENSGRTAGSSMDIVLFVLSIISIAISFTLS